MARAVGNPKIHSDYSASGGRLIFKRDNASTGIEWGEDGSGIDTTWFGETAGAKLHWIVSSDTLALTSADLSITGAANLTIASTAVFAIHEVASRGACVASSPDHWINVGMIASGSVVTVWIPAFASA